MTAGRVAANRLWERALRPTLAAAAVVVSILAGGCSGAADGAAPGGGREVVVMAASSLTDVMELVFGDSPNVIPVLSGSSTLVAQLAAGAEADVLITANAATMDRAVSEGSVQGEPVVIAMNTLVLATAPGNPGHVVGLADLARDDLLVGLCADEVPCGTLALEALGEAGITPAVDTFESNVRALAAKLALGELDASLIYSTDAARAGLVTVDAPELPDHVNRYHIASVSAEPPTEVREVIGEFFGGNTGYKALHAHGFLPP